MSFENPLKKMLSLSIMVTLLFKLHAQEKGMHFEHNTSWEKILAKAKGENKYIFVDCFTTWCGPCKMMATKIFPLDSVGKFYNTHFLNVKLQIDSIKSDNYEVKNWYSTSHEFVNKYPISAYPTYLLFNPNGELKFQFVGSMEADSFIAKGKWALNSSTIIPENKFYAALSKYRAGERSPAFLYQLSSDLVNANDVDNNMDVVKDYFATQTDFYKKDNLEILIRLTNKNSDTGFKMTVAHPQKVDSILGNRSAFYAIRWIIINDEFLNIKENQKPTNANWVRMEKNISKKYPTLPYKVFAFAKYTYYAKNRNWAALTKTLNSFTKKVDEILEPGELNFHAWNIFKNCNEKDYLESALNWSRLSFGNQTKSEPGYIDTYANLLYKLGRKKEALTWEKKAQVLAIKNGADKGWGQDVIDKINKGEKTW